MKNRNSKLDRELEALRKMRDEDIDTSDIPEVTDWRGAAVGRFYRPIKEPVTLRLDVDVIEWLKSEGPGYQTRINTLLRTAMTSSTIPAAQERRVLDEGIRHEPRETECVPHYPSLEKHGQLEKWNNIAGIVVERGSLFAPSS